MKPKFKIIIADTTQKVVLASKHEPMTIEDVMDYVERALLAYGFTQAGLDDYFEGCGCTCDCDDPYLENEEDFLNCNSFPSEDKISDTEPNPFDPPLPEFGEGLGETINTDEVMDKIQKRVDDKVEELKKETTLFCKNCGKGTTHTMAKKVNSDDMNVFTCKECNKEKIWG